MMLRWLALWTVLVGLLAPIAAFACDSDHHPFDSSAADPRHGATIQSGSLVLKPRKGMDAFIAETTPITPTTGHDIDICVTMTFTAVGQDANDTAGVAFWSVDADNYTYFGLTSAGLGYVEQRVNATTRVLVDFRPVLGAHIGQGASNRIEITTMGKDAVISVNDREFDRIVGQPPANIQMMLLAVAGGTKSTTTTFDDLTALATTVVSLGDYEPSEQAKAGGCNGVAMIDDPFDSWDARWWGETRPEVTIAEGHLTVAPTRPDQSKLWTDAGGGDIDLCSTVSMTPDKGGAGLLFWLETDDDYAALLVTKDGHASAEQWVEGQRTEVLAPVAITNDPSGNKLKVSIRGERAEIYVNGAKIGSITAAPDAGRKIGVTVTTEKGARAKGSFDDFVVARPAAHP